MTSLPTRITLQKRHWQIMAAHCQASIPEEACGIVAGLKGYSLEVFPVENSLHSPVRFKMEPRRQLEIFNLLDDRSWEMLAIYHSHPAGPGIPSPTDIAEAHYPDAVQLIWSPLGREWTCQAFLIQAGEVGTIPLHIASGAG